MEFSSDNYLTLWELLCSRYNNSLLLIHNHVHSIFELEQLMKETVYGLRNFIYNIQKHIRILETIKQPVNQWDTLLIFIITFKLYKYTIREWEKHKVNQEFPKLTELTNFLKSRADWL